MTENDKQGFVLLHVESLNQEGLGVAHCEGKVVFVQDALPYEQALCKIEKRKRDYDLASCCRLEKKSFLRQDPPCPHFYSCGGCTLQHIFPHAQLAAKQRIVEQTLWYIGHIRATCIGMPIQGPDWFYRNRARLSAHFVEKKGVVFVGFREKKSHRVNDMRSCCVLVPPLARLIPFLSPLVQCLDIRCHVPVIEMVSGETLTVLLFRHLVPLSERDYETLRSFSEQHDVQIWLQGNKDNASAIRLNPRDHRRLFYSLPDFCLKMYFLPFVFTQVNHTTNRSLVRLAMSLLNVRPDEKIADFFCGMGNFSLPMARLNAHVIGIDCNQLLVDLASKNAQENNLEDSAHFFAIDLYQVPAHEVFSRIGPIDKLFLDPPRDGALSICQNLPRPLPRRIVYVSCHPATLARDAAVLINQSYFLSYVTSINLFPQTSHIEVLAVFDLDS